MARIQVVEFSMTLSAEFERWPGKTPQKMFKGIKSHDLGGYVNHGVPFVAHIVLLLESHLVHVHIVQFVSKEIAYLIFLSLSKSLIMTLAVDDDDLHQRLFRK